jgi:hypothetical protein
VGHGVVVAGQHLAEPAAHGWEDIANMGKELRAVGEVVQGWAGR